MDLGTIVMLASLGVNFILAILGILLKGKLSLAFTKYDIIVKLMNAVQVSLEDKELSEVEIKTIMGIVNELIE